MITKNNKFAERLHRSEAARQFVTDWYRKYGIQVDEPDLEVAPDYQDRLLYVDGGDMFILLNDWVKIEVKHRPNIKFTSAKDFGRPVAGIFKPFPDLIVCAKHSFDRADPKPRLYIHLNADMSHAAVVYSRDWQRWTVRTVPDPYYGTEQLCYHAVTSDVEFRPTDGPPPLVNHPPMDPPCQTC